MMRMLLVVDHAVVREGVKRILADEPDIAVVTGLPPKGGSLPLKLDSPIEGSSSLSIIMTPSGIEPSEVNSLPLPAKAGSPSEVSLWVASRGISLSLFGLATLGAVAFHPNTLRRALTNLMQNALEAMPQGGTLTLRGQRSTTHVHLAISDTGIGIPADELPLIFEPLHTTKPAGTGLGLYLVQEIMAAHDGHIEVQSTLGQGTTFNLTLPRTGKRPPLREIISHG